MRIEKKTIRKCSVVNAKKVKIDDEVFAIHLESMKKEIS